jgi:hypothetical protein
LRGDKGRSDCQQEHANRERALAKHLSPSFLQASV